MPIIKEGVDKETGFPYAVWERQECTKDTTCVKCEDYDRFNDLCDKWFFKGIVAEK